jgi:hypothetical protein
VDASIQMLLIIMLLYLSLSSNIKWINKIWGGYNFFLWRLNSLFYCHRDCNLYRWVEFYYLLKTKFKIINDYNIVLKILSNLLKINMIRDCHHDQGSLILKRSWSGITDTEDNRDLWSYLPKRLLLILKIIMISDYWY